MSRLQQKVVPMNDSSHDDEVRFGFGANWSRFVGRGISPAQRADAADDLRRVMGHRLDGLTFLDIGCGSGLHSLAAQDLGAKAIRSFDYDAMSVASTRLLQNQFGGEQWVLAEVGDVLDVDAMGKLGRWDVVYSWGVLHHAGDLWRAIENASELVVPGGELFISIYNDQGLLTNYWKAVKRLANLAPELDRLLVAVHWPYHVGLRTIVRLLKGRVRLERGMSYNSDLRDWIGGWPFETARPDEVVNRLAASGFLLKHLVTVGRRNGCNEFVFVRSGD